MNSNAKIVHEKYHAKTGKSHKIIKDNNFTYRLLIQTLRSTIKKGANILDIGCGAGTISFYLASKGHKVTGIDISKKAIQACKESATNLLLEIDFRVIDFPNENIRSSFDVVVFTEVIEHLENDKKALKQIHKLLNMNGLLILSTPSAGAPLHKLGLTHKFDKEVGHLRRYSASSLEKILAETDFKVMSIRKTEGILRNFLFVNPVAGRLVRYIKFFLSDWVTFLDNISLSLFGESNYIIVAKKIEKKKK